MVCLNQLFTFVLAMTKKYNIDSSHSESHSMDVLHYANQIANFVSLTFPYILEQTNVIFSAAVLHDLCDRKYITVETGLNEIDQFLENKLTEEEKFYTKEIINTMSYSKVKKNGYPELGKYEMAYHAVREADLLSSYDFDRSLVYKMNQGLPLTKAYEDALKLFNERMFNYNTDKLFISKYSQIKSVRLSEKAIARMKSWKQILRRTI